MRMNKKINYSNIANKQLELIQNKLFNSSGQLMYKPNKTVASLWDYSAYFTAIVKMYQLDQDRYESIMKQTIDDLEWYLVKDRQDGHLVYASENGQEKPVFYDDNDWLAIGFIGIYKTNKKTIYLDKAKRILSFIFEGWQTKDGGGLLWKEFPSDFKPHEIVRNTCINAPAAYASSMIYQLTNDKTYLDWAVKIYDWTKKILKDTNSGLYFDNISQNNIIEETYWTYNVGVMIAAGSVLYDITKDKAYADDVLYSIQSAYEKLTVNHEDKQINYKYYDDHPWFRVYLFQGLLESYKYLEVKKTITKYFDDITLGFDYVYKTYQNKEDFIIDKWSLIPSKTNEVESLFASGNLESIAIFECYNRLKNKGEHN